MANADLVTRGPGIGARRRRQRSQDEGGDPQAGNGTSIDFSFTKKPA